MLTRLSMNPPFANLLMGTARLGVRLPPGGTRSARQFVCKPIAAGLCLAALPILAGAAPLQPISTRKAALPPPAGGNSGSVLQSLSPDGRFVLFSSSASDLVTNAGNQLGMNVYLANLIAIIAVSLWNFVLTLKYGWNKPTEKLC